MSPNDEDFGLGFKIGSLLGFIVGLVFAHLMSSATSSEDENPTRCNCVCAVESEGTK